MASPNRETEAMLDGSDAVSDWPLLNALLNTASGATWVSLHHGGGVGMGFSQHAGVVIVCDGTPEAARRIARVLWNDPATGVMRHADAGYELALQCAREHSLESADAYRGRHSREHAPCRRRCAAGRGAEPDAGCARVLSAPVDLRLTRADLGRIRRSRAVIERLIARGETAYGVNTGFGSLASERISTTDLARLQHNLVLSHAAGTGAPLSDAIVRLVLVLKIASLAQGYSGIRPQTLQALQALLRAGVYPLIPAQGSVGASGDLAPLAHLSAALLGVGQVRYQGRVLSARRGLALARPEAAEACGQGRPGAAQRHAGIDRAGAGGTVRDRECVRRRAGHRRDVGRCAQGQRHARLMSASTRSGASPGNARWLRNCARCCGAAGCGPRTWTARRCRTPTRCAASRR